MKTQASGGSPSSLPSIGGVASAPATEDAGSTASGSDFLSLISQIYSGNPATQSPNGAKPATESTGMTQTEGDPSSVAALSPLIVSLLAGVEATAKISSGENSSNVKPKPQNPAAKTSGAPDDTVASCVMALFAQTALVPNQEIALVPKTGTTSTASTGDSSVPMAVTNEATALTSAENAAASHPAVKNSVANSTEVAVKAETTTSKPADPVAPEIAKASAASVQNTLPVSAGPDVKAATDPAMTESAVVQAQVAGVQGNGIVKPGSVKAISRDGTGVALDKERMNNTTEKNEIAGRAVKKLPRDAQTRDFSTGSGTADLAKASSDAAATKKESTDLTLAQELSTKASPLAAEPAAPIEKSVSSAAAQVEHVTRLVTQEAMSVRQSGATSLAVSLKVDSHTQIFLQLSNNGGQMQASLRLERGSIEGLGNHWNDLQASLARQNIQLLPLAGNNGTSMQNDRNPAGTGNGSQAGSSFQQAPGNSRRQMNEPNDPAVVADGSVATKKKQKSGASAIKGWESWA